MKSQVYKLRILTFSSIMRLKFSIPMARKLSAVEVGARRGIGCKLMAQNERKEQAKGEERRRD